ncbi:30S ribosomal protein S8 [Candidatus Ichthyocystis hellenicum]|uniref:30S ribosomal protein S8 n=1 Tax=Candidatus Ichthyocystis hellenicum TaxID=1561003 RepID=UPI000A885720|nr:30S ribosomal protein S8 [Candidatus Ichthyocystis hellenicum]
MSLSDPVADMLTRIRNAHMAKKLSVEVLSSRLIKSIASVLMEGGYIESYEVFSPRKGVEYLKIFLKYYAGFPVINMISRVSRPGLRSYASKDSLPDVVNGLGIAIMTTSSGVMTSREAKKRGIGGEVICFVS